VKGNTVKDPLEEARATLAQVAEAERGWETYRMTGGDKHLARQRLMAARELAERAAPRLLKELCDELEPARVELRLRRAVELALRAVAPPSQREEALAALEAWKARR